MIEIEESSDISDSANVIGAKTNDVVKTTDKNEKVIEIVECPKTSSIDNVNGKLLMEGFKKMESEVKILRDELMAKVDETQKQDEKEEVTLNAICQKLDKLETLLVENKSEIKTVSTGFQRLLIITFLLSLTKSL